MTVLWICEKYHLPSSISSPHTLLVEGEGLDVGLFRVRLGGYGHPHNLPGCYHPSVQSASLAQSELRQTQH